MALPISISRRRTDIGTGWDARIDEMATDLALVEKTTQKFTYDVSVNGGAAASTIQLGDLPVNAVITAMWYEVMLTLTGGTPAVTVALEVETDAAAGAAPVAAIAANSGTNVWTTLAASNVKHTTVGSFAADSTAMTALEMAAGISGTYIKTTGPHAVQITIAGTAPADNLTAGRLNIYVSYFISV